MTEHPGRENAYPIGKYPAVNQNELLLLRASAIQAYATLEFQLALLFSQWVGTTSDVGGLVFFRITSSHARNGILNALKRKKIQDQYDLFWRSLLKFIGALDRRRNDIVHWVVTNNIDLNLPHAEASRLTMSSLASVLNRDQNTAFIDERDLNDFIKRCQFASQMVGLFYMLQQGAELPPTLTDMFSHKLVYPPPGARPNLQTAEGSPKTAE